MHPRFVVFAWVAACGPLATSSSSSETSSTPPPPAEGGDSGLPAPTATAPDVGATVTVYLPPSGDTDIFVMVADADGRYTSTTVTRDPSVVLTRVPVGGSVTWAYGEGFAVLRTIEGVADGDVLRGTGIVEPSGTVAVTVPEAPPFAAQLVYVSTPCSQRINPAFPLDHAGGLLYGGCNSVTLPAFAAAYADGYYVVPDAVAWGTAPVLGQPPALSADVTVGPWVSNFGRAHATYVQTGPEGYVDLGLAAMVGPFEMFGATTATAAVLSPGDAVEAEVPALAGFHDRLLLMLRGGDTLAATLYRTSLDLAATGETVALALDASDLPELWDAPQLDPATLEVARPLPEGCSCGGADANYGSVQLVAPGAGAWWDRFGPYTTRATRPELDPIVEAAVAEKTWEMSRAAVAAVPGGYDALRSSSSLEGTWRTWMGVQPVGSELCVLEHFDPRYW